MCLTKKTVIVTKCAVAVKSLETPHSLNQHREVVTWKGFQVPGVSRQEVICGPSRLLNVFETVGLCCTVNSSIPRLILTTRLSQKKRRSIVTLRHEGQSIREISRTSKVSSSQTWCFMVIILFFCLLHNTIRGLL